MNIIPDEQEDIRELCVKITDQFPQYDPQTCASALSAVLVQLSLLCGIPEERFLKGMSKAYKFYEAQRDARS